MREGGPLSIINHIYKDIKVGAPTEQAMRDFIASHTNDGWLEELLLRIENT